MKTISYLPHTAIDIYGIAFLNLVNPQSYDDSSEVIAEIKNLGVTSSAQKGVFYWSDPNLYKDMNSSPVLFKREWTLEATDPEEKIPGNWNSVAIFDGDMSDNMTVYSLTYWDSVVSPIPEFGTLTVTYSSISEVTVSTGEIDIESDYISHVSKVANVNNSPAEPEFKSYDNTHPQLNEKIVKEKGSTSIDYTVSFRDPQILHGYEGDGEFASSNSKYGNYITQYIPESDDKDARLIVSKHLGVAYYEPNNKRILFWTGESIPTPEVDITGVDVYLVEWEILVLYYPEDYDIRVFQYRVDTKNWVELTTVQERKIVIPSYFNILPLYISQERIGIGTYDWRLRHIFTYPTLISDSQHLENITGDKWSVLYDNMYNTGYVTLEKNNSIMTGSERRLISVFLSDDMIDGSESAVTDSATYWTSQYYISFQTFKQCLRNFKNWSVQIKDCGILCSKGRDNYFVPYSLYTEPRGFNSLNIRKLPSNVIVDNLLYYDKDAKVIGRIDCLNNRDSVSKSYSDYEDIQMKNGVIVGYKDGTWKGVNQ